MKYTVTSVIPPRLYQGLDNKTYIVPQWIEVLANTTIEDINWIKLIYEDKPNLNQETNIWKFKSSNGDGEYIIKRNGFNYSCNCSGFYRVKDREKGCKHIQQVKKDMEF